MTWSPLRRRATQPQGPVGVNSRFNFYWTPTANPNNFVRTGTLANYASGANDKGRYLTPPADGKLKLTFGPALAYGSKTCATVVVVCTLNPGNLWAHIVNLGANLRLGYRDTDTCLALYTQYRTTKYVMPAAGVSTLVASIDANHDVIKLWVNGKPLGIISTAIASNANTATEISIGGGVDFYDATGTYFKWPLNLVAGGAFFCTDAEARAWSSNPWQLFTPIQQPIWVPLAAGGSGSAATSASSQAQSSSASASRSINAVATSKQAQGALASAAAARAASCASKQAQSTVVTSGPAAVASVAASQAQSAVTAGARTRSAVIAGAQAQSTVTAGARARSAVIAASQAQRAEAALMRQIAAWVSAAQAQSCRANPQGDFMASIYRATVPAQNYASTVPAQSYSSTAPAQSYSSTV